LFQLTEKINTAFYFVFKHRTDGRADGRTGGRTGGRAMNITSYFFYIHIGI
jgi:hypothetical protein